MKKLIFFTFFILGISFYSFSQVDHDAIGLRLDAGYISGMEVSYQKGFNSRNRLELDLGFGLNSQYHSLGVIGAFHWDWNIVHGLNWYVGPGAGIGFGIGRKGNDNFFNFAIGGQIGLEYDFNTLGVPILASIDTRPMWNIFNDIDPFGWGLALGVRYTF
ncbi:MAG: hypothetical protein LBQ22_05090 [Bacteroidales bacterium]|jgi:hypothetical protein|nr:hypothetical protein [Bacteroidales bacterium]